MVDNSLGISCFLNIVKQQDLDSRKQLQQETVSPKRKFIHVSQHKVAFGNQKSDNCFSFIEWQATVVTTPL